MDVIGFGTGVGDKVYNKGGDPRQVPVNAQEKDNNPNYAWDKERGWEARQARVNFL